jgi:hypothetical protein
MKYIKKFEKLDDNFCDFKKGDIVYCIIPGSTALEEDKPYTISSVRIGDFLEYLINLIGDNNSEYGYNTSRFITELEYKEKKYNL